MTAIVLEVQIPHPCWVHTLRHPEFLRLIRTVWNSSPFDFQLFHLLWQVDKAEVTAGQFQAQALRSLAWSLVVLLRLCQERIAWTNSLS